jgi:lipopolysaccharide biosynthesis glycosyltransferase
MNIVFCADRRVLTGLHVAIYSVLHRYAGKSRPDFTIFSDDIDEDDRRLLQTSLDTLNKPYILATRRIDPCHFMGFEQLNGSWAQYYRLLIPSMLDVERYLYLDADILCDLDVSSLERLDMGEAPAGLVSEAPLSGCADRDVAKILGASAEEPYFNSGVMLVNAVQWRSQQVTEQALEFLRTHPAAYWDQSALNVVLHRRAYEIDERFNIISNMRKNWPRLRKGIGQTDSLIHFVDYPKPWDLGSEFIHPHYRLWRAILEKTPMRAFRSWRATPIRKLPRTGKAWAGYKKGFKDCVLFGLYRKGLISRVKGIT